jgi:hypothetical protein
MNWREICRTTSLVEFIRVLYVLLAEVTPILRLLNITIIVIIIWCYCFDVQYSSS